MQFTNNRQNAVNIQPKQIVLYRTNNYINNNAMQIQKPIVLPKIDYPPPIKKMKWGEPTWFLFHTLAHKVKEEHFTRVRNELLNNISMICSNLPCPNCADHATLYLKQTPFFSIQTKQGLKDMLFKFHNDVNAKKNVASFPYEELDAKYQCANTVNIIQHFMFYFQDKSYSIRMIANDMHRTRLTQLLKTWFMQNLQYFDL